MGMSAIVDLEQRKSSCLWCGARQNCIAASLEAADGALLEPVKRPSRVVRRGQHLFLAGDQLPALYVIRSGSVKTYAITEDGEEQIIGFHLPGDTIGFDALATGEARSNAAALETSSICTLPLEGLWQVAERSVTLRRELIRGMSREVLRLTGMLQNERRTADQRLAAFLLDHADNMGRRGYSTEVFNLSMSRRDIGKYLDMATETVSRVLTRFQGLGLLATNRNEIRLLDPTGLKHLVTEGGIGDTSRAVTHH